jgi:hypothetical protein
MIVAVVAAILSLFKYHAEQQNRLVVLNAHGQQSFWHHAPQADGALLTQFALRFHVTNMTDGLLHLSKDVRFNWPWIGRNRIFSSMVVTEHPDPKESIHSSDFAVGAHGRQHCSADLMVLGLVGGAKRRRPMRVSVSLQDHAGRWHKLVFPNLRDRQFGLSYLQRSWSLLSIMLILTAAFVAIVIAVEIWGWIYLR